MATDAQRLSELETRLALEALNTDFCHFLDHGDIEALVDLFTEDAIYTHGTRRSVGRAEIRDLFSRRSAAGPRTARHLYSCLRRRGPPDGSGSGSSVCLTFACDGAAPIVPAEPHLVADFVDEYSRGTDGRWRISRRHIERIFLAEGNRGPVGLLQGGTAS
ncbi:MAG: nuclear transport factor 2 family protein [Pseudohongiellaceae bacterium]